MCTAELSSYLVCKTMLFNWSYFIQAWIVEEGAFTKLNIHYREKNQGLFKDINFFFQFQELFKDMMFFSRIIQGLCKQWTGVNLTGDIFRSIFTTQPKSAKGLSIKTYCCSVISSLNFICHELIVKRKSFKFS